MESAWNSAAISPDNFGLPWTLSAGQCSAAFVSRPVVVAAFHQPHGRCLVDLQLCRSDASGKRVSRSAARASGTNVRPLPRWRWKGECMQSAGIINHGVVAGENVAAGWPAVGLML